MTETNDNAELDLKLVATTLIWTNSGTEDMPLWRCTGGKEYVISKFDHEPTLAEIGKVVDERRHLIENHYKEYHETLSGWQLYLTNSMTHNEFLQYNVSQSVDFPATDLTEVDAVEEMKSILGE